MSKYQWYCLCQLKKKQK